MSTLRLSKSRIKLWRRCRKAYRLHYDERRKEMDRSDAKRGRAIHACLERLARTQFERGDPIKMGSRDLARELIDVAADMDLDPAEAKDALKTIKGFGDISYGTVALPPEHRFELPLTDDVSILGFIDIAIMEQHADGSFTVVVIDYKTGLMPPPDVQTARYIEDSGVYGIAALALFPGAANVQVVYEHLSYNVTVVVDFDDDLARFHRRKILQVAAEIRSGDDQARVGPGCARCTFRGDCDAYKGAIRSAMSEDPSVTLPATLTDDDVCELFERTKTQIKLLESRKRLLGAELIQRFGEDDRRIMGGGVTATRVVQDRKSFDSLGASALAGVLGVDLQVIVAQAGKLDRAALIDIAMSCDDAERRQRALRVIEEHSDSNASQHVRTRRAR